MTRSDLAVICLFLILSAVIWSAALSTQGAPPCPYSRGTVCRSLWPADGLPGASGAVDNPDSVEKTR